MKTIGLIGGTSWLSSAQYYAHINKEINARLGGLNFGRIVFYSVNMGELAEVIGPQNWPVLTDYLAELGVKLTAAGAECVLVCANTPHIVADDLEPRLTVPLIHIAEATAAAILEEGMTRVGLLGTKLTMQEAFYTDRLARHGIETLIPDEEDCDFINHTIFAELAKDQFLPETKARYLTIIDKLRGAGAQGVILGCTEIPLLLDQNDTDLPLFDTLKIHAQAAVEFALGD